MRWRDFHPPDGSKHWLGLDLEVERAELSARAPPFRVCASDRRMRIECAGEPVLWAHTHSWNYGVWLLSARRSETWRVVPPITRSEIASVASAHASPRGEPWWAAWSRWFARELVTSPRSPLSAGRWALTPARMRGAPAATGASVNSAQVGVSYGGANLATVGDVATCLDADALRWESWFINGSGGLVRSRLVAPADGARARAYRKRARDGTLPPVLVMFVSGLDMYLVLDGHDRLRASLAEGQAPAMLALWKVRRRSWPAPPEEREKVLRDVERKQQLRERQTLATTREDNERLIAAFHDGDALEARTAAWPLVGGRERWEHEVRAEGVPAEALIFRGEPPQRG
jgi:hypothetical protein